MTGTTYFFRRVAVVTCPGDIDEEDYWPEGVIQPQGALVIDGSVTHNDTTYTVARIGAYAFYGCSGITSVNIPSSVNIIKGYAFYDCSNLASVTIPASVADFGNYVFTGTALPDPIYKDSVFVYMPATATGVYTYFERITEDCGSGDGIEDLELPQIQVYVTDGCIVIDREDGSAEISANVYDLSGRLVVSLQTAGKTPALPNGIYVVRISDQTARKVVVKR